MMASLILWLEQSAHVVSLPIFVLLGGIIEEIIAPIPSPLISTLAGSIAVSQKLGIPYLLWLCLLATLSKTIGAWFFYILGDKLEDVAVPRFGKYIGVTHEDLKYFGAHFKGTMKDWLILIVFRSIPVMPSTPISVLCGILKISQKTFLIGTYVGFYVRNLTFIFLGYTGLTAIDSLMTGIDSVETILKLVIVIGGCGVLGWLYWRRSKGRPVHLVT
jgi:membrane protein DedA with SNARE-associated domain